MDSDLISIARQMGIPEILISSALQDGYLNVLVSLAAEGEESDDEMMTDPYVRTEDVPSKYPSRRAKEGDWYNQCFDQE